MLLDVKGLNDENDTEPSNTHLPGVIAQIEHFEQKKFPIVLMSGEPDSFDENYVGFIEKYKNSGLLFEKNDYEKVIKKLRELCGQGVEHDLKHRFPIAFELLAELDELDEAKYDSKKIKTSAKKDIIDAFSNYETPKLKDLRYIVESIRNLFVVKDICPKGFTLWEWCRFFDIRNPHGAYSTSKSKEKRYNICLNNESKVSENLSAITRFVLYVVQNTSHKGNQNDFINITNDFSKDGARGVLYIFMDFLKLIKFFLDSNPKQKNWIKTPTT